MAQIIANPAHWGIALFLGAMLSAWGRKIMDSIVSSSSNPLIHLFGHAALGAALATLTTYAGTQWGVTPAEAATAWAAFVGFLPTIEALVSANAAKSQK